MTDMTWRRFNATIIFHKHPGTSSGFSCLRRFRTQIDADKLEQQFEKALGFWCLGSAMAAMVWKHIAWMRCFIGWITYLKSYFLFVQV